MNVTAIDFGPEVDELAEAGLTPVPSARIRPPRIAESPVALECRRFTTLELNNDRALVLGEVVAMHIADHAVLDPARCYVDTPALDLIGRMHGAGWYTRTTDRFELPRIKPSEWAGRKAAE
jgi:flavin reductase (DIM6/NTAB) family NADH-FMN oxidoreductase RutF